MPVSQTRGAWETAGRGEVSCQLCPLLSGFLELLVDPCEWKMLDYMELWSHPAAGLFLGSSMQTFHSCLHESHTVVIRYD